MLALVVAVASAVIGHNASQGTSAFVVHDNGKISIHLEVLEADLPELCDVEINIADPVRRQAALQKLESCAAREFPHWLRFHLDAAPCTVLAGRWSHGAGLLIDLYAEAVCEEPAGHTLTMDWGLFQQSSLDHQSASTLTLPDGTKRRALLSKRKNKVITAVPDPRARAAQVAVVVAVGVVAVVAGALFVRRRRRHFQG